MNKRAFLSFCMILILVLFNGLMLISHPASAANETFIVDSDADLSDNNPGDCTCQTSSGTCTLRAAIEEANACSGSQTINFSPPSTPMIIQPATELPALTDDYTIINATDWIIDSSTWFRPRIILSGANGIQNGITIHSSNNSIAGLTIIDFQGYGILIENGASSNNVNYNVVSANNASGIRINGASSNENVIWFNKVGLDPQISSAQHMLHPVNSWGNGHHGISVWDGDKNVVMYNWVANNKWSGITSDNVPSASITYNTIGYEQNAVPAGNVYNGIHIGNNAQDILIANNQIGNNQLGIYITGNSKNITIQNNTISQNNNNTSYGGGIAVEGSSQDITIQDNFILNNTAIEGGGIYIGSGTQATITENTINDNEAVSETGDDVQGGGISIVGATAVTITQNTISTNSASSTDLNDPSAITWAHGGGIFAKYVPWIQIADNEISGNAISANYGLGGGISTSNCAQVYIETNEVTNNTSNTNDADGAGINVLLTTAQLVINRNWLSANQTQPGAALGVEYSKNAEITNNVIVDNQANGVYLNKNSNPTQFIHNTIANNTGNGVYNAQSYLGLYNNIIASNSGIGLKDEDLTSEIYYAGNDVWDNSGGASNRMITFNFQVDPLFIDPSNDQYGLQPSSPLIDQANASYSSSDSFSGISRPQGAGADIGAYEIGYLYLPLVKR